MESEFCISEEHARDKRCSHHDDFFQINCRPYHPTEDFHSVCSLYWEFYLSALRKDLSKEITIDDGIKILQVESHINLYIKKGCEISLAFNANDPIALLIYHRVYSELVCAWVGFVKPEYQNKKVGITLLKSIKPMPRKFIFQTLNSNPNHRLLKITEGVRTLLHEEPIHTTWMVDIMDWSK